MTSQKRPSTLTRATQLVGEHTGESPTDFRALPEHHSLKERRDLRGAAWFNVSANNEMQPDSYMALNIYQTLPTPPPLQRDKYDRGVCIKRYVPNVYVFPRAHTYKRIYHEVHPCWHTFSLADTELYKPEIVTLESCTETGIAFWPSRLPITCGLVWPNMRFARHERAMHGTCLQGPGDPGYVVVSTPGWSW
jgi:hypothetical protein